MKLQSMICAASLAALLAGCTSELFGEDTNRGALNQEGGATVATDLASYGHGNAVIVTFDGLPGDPSDWVAIAPEGASDVGFVAWQYTNGAASGQVVFRDNLPGGTYVARAYPMDGWELAAESASFDVLVDQAAVSTSQLVYSESDRIVVDYAGFTSDRTNWITVVPADADAFTYAEWFYTNGDTSGRMTFEALPAGDYEVRAFFADGFTQVARAGFRVSGEIVLAPEQAVFVAGNDVTVEYHNMPGNELDWIALAPVGSDDDAYVAWMYTGGNASGAASFSGIPAGTYVARAYANDGWERLAESSEIVVEARHASLSLDKTSYTRADEIVVSFAGMGGSATDWITIVPVDAPADYYLEYHYTNGNDEGRMTFGTLYPGEYEVRAFIRDGFELVGTARFTVTEVAAPSESMRAMQLVPSTR